MNNENSIISYFLNLLSGKRNDDKKEITNAFVQTINKFDDESFVLQVLKGIDDKSSNPLVNFQIYTDAYMELDSSSIYPNNEDEALTNAGKKFIK